MTAPTNPDAETTPSRAVVVSDACSAFSVEKKHADWAVIHKGRIVRRYFHEAPALKFAQEMNDSQNDPSAGTVT